MLHQKVTGNFPTKKSAVRKGRALKDPFVFQLSIDDTMR
jgi:hypothetical protein